MTQLSLKLTPEEKQALERFIREMAAQINHRARVRGWAILALAQGWTIREICNHHRVSSRTARNWISRFRKGGVTALYDRPRPRCLTTKQSTRLLEYSRRLELLQLRSRTKIQALRRLMPSYRQLAQWVRQNYGIRLSHERVRQIIRQGLCHPAQVRGLKL